MITRNLILQNVRKNRPAPVALPSLPEFPSLKNGALLPAFQTQLEAMGGRWFTVADPISAHAKIASLFPDAKAICSAVRTVPGTLWIGDVTDPHALNNVEVGIVRSPLGVAENGAIWLSQEELVVNALGVLSQHLVVLLNPATIVANMHHAYAWLNLQASPYGVFMAGPSATGDIEGVIVHGAQGARSLTVLLIPETIA